MRDDGTAPARGEWSFDESVTERFDDMLERSIPDYYGMRDLVRRIGLRFVQPHTDVVDLGCSRGGALASLLDHVPDSTRLVGVETSRPMLEAARARFRREPRVDVVDLDLRESYPDAHASLTLAVLTVMFVPVEYRLRLLGEVFRSTVPGGAFVMVEKVLGSDPAADALLSHVYREHKLTTGYTADEIDRKRLALEGRLVPLVGAFNEEQLRRAGFATVECFWRSMNFAGWVAIRER